MTKVVRIRSNEDMSELWANVRKPNSKMNVWCNGLKETSSTNVSHKQKKTNPEDGAIRSRLARKMKFRKLLTLSKKNMVPIS